MTTTPEPAKEDELLVNVKAQVMTQKDEIGGWIPMGQGGLSCVALRRRSQGTCEASVEYLIHGQRLSDKSEVLNCVLRTDLLYKNPNPTFHYWKSDERRFGLTFQTPGDANAFHRGVKRAMADLRSTSKSGPGEKKNSVTGNCDVNGDDDVFMELDLPLGRKDSNTNSASTNSTTTSSPGVHSPALIHDSHSQHLHKIEYGPKQIARKPSPSSVKSNKSASSGDSSRDFRDDGVWVRNNEKRPSLRSRDDDLELKDPYYVQFAKPTNTNEYSYPALEPFKPTVRDGPYKKPQTGVVETDLNPFQAPLPAKKRTDRDMTKNSRQSKHLISRRSRCCYCNEMYVHGENHRGSCQEAPDQFQNCIEGVSCIYCARGMLYHCLSDADGDFTHPCVCDTSDEKNTKKWTALAVLSLFVPCLWCYWPLIACHSCGVGCGCCGGRHKTASSSTTSQSNDVNNC